MRAAGWHKTIKACGPRAGGLRARPAYILSFVAKQDYDGWEGRAAKLRHERTIQSNFRQKLQHAIFRQKEKNPAFLRHT